MQWFETETRIFHNFPISNIVEMPLIATNWCKIGGISNFQTQRQALS